MGFPSVPQGIPTSPAQPLSPSPPGPRESRGTPLPRTHPTRPPVSSNFPSHLPFGDPIPSPKPDSSFRIGFCNIGGFPSYARHNPKVTEIKNFIASHNLDLFGGCESNLNWHSLPDQSQLKEWFRSADSCRTFAAHNLHEKFGRSQFGGTFWIASGHATVHIASGNRDPLKLGRWVSCSLLGRTGKHLHIIFAYRPCSNTSGRLRSVYAQHHRFFDSQQRYVCPRTAFLDDLGTFIATKRSRGDAILLLADMNGDIRHPTLTSFASSLQLHELILQKFPSLPLPATFHRGGRSGTVPIDGAWATDDLTIDAISWRDAPSSPGDHRAIVLDLNLVDCISKPRYSITRPPGRRLNCSLPATRTCYLMALCQYTNKHHLEHRLNQLFLLARSSSTSSAELLAGLEKFDKLKADGMKHAEKTCRRFNSGLVQFSPELNRWRLRCQLWRLVYQRRLGHPIKAKYLRRLANACSVENPLSVSKDIALFNYHLAWAQYGALKPQHELLHSNFLHAKLQDPTLSDTHHKAIARLVALESLRDAYRRIRALKNQQTGRSISAVEYSTPTGPALATSRQDVERELSSALGIRFMTAHGSPFLTDPLAALVGPYGTGPAAKAILQGTFICPPGVDDDTCKYIEALQFPSLAARQTQVSAILRPDDFISHWKKAKERTSSSPSGLHFGHYKAATCEFSLANLHARFTQLVFMTGLSISRYQQGLQVILEKKQETSI